MKKCGLLGRRLSHSFSPKIHRELGDYSYELFEVEPDELCEFIRSGDFDGINVTIPYKREVLPFLDEISERAKKIGSVNTVYRRGDKLYGDNTDYAGFLYMAECSGVDFEGKKAIVLGSGGASCTVCAVLSDLGCADVVVISRSGDDNYDNISRHFDADVLVNTTPVGMYPDVYSSPLSLDGFFRLGAVFDIIYNPQKTVLCLEAEKRGIKAIGGLSMLVGQAFYASEIFCERALDARLIDKICKKISMEMKNIVLIGMPGSGKSTCGRALAKALGREFFDTDAMIEQKCSKSIEEIFGDCGEEYFRDAESDVIRECAGKVGCVIATGGGALMREQNRAYLLQNGFFIWLCRKISALSTKGRPLSKSRAALSALERERAPVYEGLADVKIKVARHSRTTVRMIMEAIDDENSRD